MFRSKLFLQTVAGLATNRHRRASSPRRPPAYYRLRHEPLEDRRVLAAVTVTNDLDLVNGDTSSIASLIADDGGDGIALREAIDAANNTAGADTIGFDAGLAGSTVNLTGTRLDIADDITLTGLGADQLTIDAQGASQVLVISNGTAHISGITLTGGNTDRPGGGGLGNYSNAMTTLSAVVVQGNQTTGISVGAGVANGGILTVIDSLVMDNTGNGTTRGGGIFNSGILSIVRSTISGNTSTDGGGIYDPGGSITITDSTISDNTATDDGGAVSSQGFLVITSSTISGNTSADSGAVFSTRATIISHSTIVNNSGGRGGGIHTGDSVTLDHTIVANNTATLSGPDISGTVTANWSLIEDTTDATIVGTNNITGLAPELGLLQGNGGPTETHALLPGSPAIDTGGEGSLLFDQRGFPYLRVHGVSIDIGAHELLPADGNLDGAVDGLDYLIWTGLYGDNPSQEPPGVPTNGDYNNDGVVDGLDYLVWAGWFGTGPPTTLIVDTLVDEFDGDLASGDVSLRDAIGWANVSPGADTITFSPALDGGTINLVLGELTITEALTIDATSLAENVTIDAQQTSRVINITAETGDFTLAGLTLTGGKLMFVSGPSNATTFSGGAIRSFTTGDLVINRSTVTGNSTTVNFTNGGGAIFARRALVIRDSVINGNYTAGSIAKGGGVFASDITIINSTISGNHTLGDRGEGGGIYSSGDVSLTNSVIDDNYTLGFRATGGGVHAFAGTISLINTTVSGNSTAGDFANGGGIISRSGDATTIIDSTISGNGTTGRFARGGGFFGYWDVTVKRSNVSGNYTLGEGGTGGGMWVQDVVTLTDSTIRGNSTAGVDASGGGIWSGIAVSLNSSTVSGNSTGGTGADGGGIHAFGDVTISQSTVTDNHVSYDDSIGGAIWTFDKPVVITGSIVAGNTAGNGNPDLYADTGLFEANHSLIGDTSDLTSDQLAQINAGVGNLLDVDPMLGPLADNGGPTFTHALLPGSPAIDAGDPAFVVPPHLDQRGYYRVVDGGGDTTARVDMGAYEYASVLPLPGDGNLDATVDGIDYIIWATHFGDDPALDPPGVPLNGDYNGDGVVDGLDYVVWAENYGTSAAAVQTVEPLAVSASAPLAVDVVLEEDYDTGATGADDLDVRRWQLDHVFESALSKKRGRRAF